MYKVLVADDEKIGRQGVQFLLRQMDVELDIYEAKNGKQAFEMIRNEHFDILLTDIKMPFMDGIELIQETIKLQPQIKIAIFSGYSDFEYAKSALSLGVSEYILKPVNPEEFKNAVLKIVKEIDQYHEDIQTSHKQDQIAQEHILFQLVNGKNTKHISKNNSEIMIDQYHYLMLIEFDDNFYEKADDFNICLKSILSLHFDYLNLNLQQSMLFIKNDHVNSIQTICKEIYNAIQVKYNKHCYIAVSERFEDNKELPSKSRILEELLDVKYYHPDTHIYVENEEEVGISSFEDVEELGKKVKLDIKMKDIAALKHHFNEFYSYYQSQGDFSNDYVKFMFSGMIKDIHGALVNTNEKELDKLIVKFYRASDFKSLSKIMNEFVVLLDDEFKQNDTLSHKEIETVIRYIYNHYNLDLSVDSLADLVCLAPSYLSHIFKKETGENLGKFIKRVRMENAKDMLEKTHEKIVSIAVACGYSNVSYFCQSFREFYGISPQKFRNQGE